MNHNKVYRSVVASVLAVAMFTGFAHAQHGTGGGEWPSYAGGTGGTKYSPLDRINAENFSQLELTWRWTTADAFLSKEESGGEWWGRSSDIFDELQAETPGLWRSDRHPRMGNLKATPLMVGGRLFLNTPLSVGVSLDAKTGQPLWIYNPKSYEDGTTAMTVMWNQRGVAYWADGDSNDERIYWGTGNGYLVCVDAKTGRPCENFGEGGKVDLMRSIPRAKRGQRDFVNALLYSVQSPPIVVRDVVITPASIADRRITKESIPGWIRGWDVRTGEELWSFHTVPQPGEFGADTWENSSNEYSGNVNVWTSFAADEELGYLYAPTGAATNDFYGSERPGNNLFSQSLICIDVETGKRVWHYQMVHHGVWDYDNPVHPNLVDVTVDGKEIKAVAQVTKQGFTYVFDRVTGEPVWPIVERPVPTDSNMPNEKLSPTQPYPTKPAPFEYQGVTIDQLNNFTPELREMAIAAIKPFRYGSLFEPPSLHVRGGTQGTIRRPSDSGGANWTGAAIDPETGILYVPSLNSYTVTHYYDPRGLYGDAATLTYTHGGRGGSPRLPNRLPVFKPPYSRITAIDLNTGEHVWMQPNGNGDEVRNHPSLKHLNLPPLGDEHSRFGPLVTKTLLIIGVGTGGTDDGPQLLARDKATGEIVGAIDLPAPGLGTPMTYEVDDRQYVALTIRSSPPELLAFTLP